MTILEKRSKIRVQALIKLVDKKEYSPEYAIGKLDDLNSKGYIVENDYDETFDYLANLMANEQLVETEVEQIVEDEPIVEAEPIEQVDEQPTEEPIQNEEEVKAEEVEDVEEVEDQENA